MRVQRLELRSQKGLAFVQSHSALGGCTFPPRSAVLRGLPVGCLPLWVG